ncbi:methionyl-tRNA formyltransferase, mitochondrial [Adelges cooleyi]|uniref:methionyl-tRNA formyltransferase, mitochondrial n=1 Tax=Adelges cooleyi TaxID=133065 RepID=UPI0021809A2E|nr:methionyl-tRNA formyltransferase, mitochondrial [Adelges cooleyi]
MLSLKLVSYKIQKSVCRAFKKPSLFHSTVSLRGKCNSSSPPWRILFFGNDDFSVKNLLTLTSKMRTQTIISRLDVVTTSKGNVVHSLAKEERLLTFEWPISKAQIEGNYDIGVVVSFGRLIPEEIIKSFPLGMINVHASLLPRWRGAAPIVYTILNGDLMSGVTVMKIHPHKFDIGEIVRQHSCSVGQHETAKQLKEKLAEMGGRLLVDTFKELTRNLRTAMPQPESGITYAPKVEKSMAVVDWETSDSKLLYNKYRALDGLWPLLTTWHGTHVRLFQVKVNRNNLPNVSDQSTPGAIVYDKRKRILLVKCGGKGGYISVGQVKISGSKIMFGYDFYSGYVGKRPECDRKFTTTRLD